jgi:PPP family 3-phenylpropionic acid transporter
LLPRWLEARGITGAELGAVAALRPFASIVSPVLFGLIADRTGLRGRLLVFACLASSVSMALVAVLGVHPGALGFGTVFVMLGFFSFFRAPVISVADVTAIEGKKQGYGTVRLWGSLGFLASALVAGHWLDPESETVFPAVIAGAMGVSALRLPRGLSRPPTRIAGAARELFGRPDFRLFLATAFLWLASHAAYDLCISLHLRDLGGSGTSIGIAWAIGTGFEIILMAFGRPLLVRFPAAKLLTFGLTAMMLRWVAYAFIPWFWMIVGLQCLHALSFAMVWLAGLEYIRKSAAPTILATAQGGFAAVGALGSGLSMLLWGPLYHAVGGTGVFASAAAVSILAVTASFRLQQLTCD